MVLTKPQITCMEFWSFTTVALREIIKDGKEMANNWPDDIQAKVWLDEVNDACTVINYRMKKTEKRTMAKTIREQIEEKIKNQKAENNSPIRKIRCDQCNWSMGRRRKNAWGDTAYLRGQLAKHLAEAHPTN